MKTYGNHFRVEDSKSILSSTYNSGIASIFDMPTIDTSDVFVNYVGVLKDIFKLDYGLVHTLVVLLKCEWIK
jgi:hypothetical protein